MVVRREAQIGMGDTYKNVAKGNARVGAQIGRLEGRAANHADGDTYSQSAGTRVVAALLDEIQVELRRARSRDEIDEPTADAIRAEVDAAAECLPLDDEQQRGRFIIMMRRAKGLVEGLSTLTVKVVEAINAVRGIQ
ncbi:hypothetical protein EV378_0221 [Pseudonocardia endophytica]|uniref:Uncharacterized protein n=1 Tax=Pseudonocardia endophytica TaxID=401976 RepID=A0A4R1HWQ4_PSEEN|nr:hypothetical protein EV378_0221 [Pseudonocardia endophytica]